MNTEIPYNVWHPLLGGEVVRLFDAASFRWGLAGGYAVEQFLGASIRAHSDIDIVVFRDDQLHLQRWLSAWQLYAADPPGTLRPWAADEELPAPIHRKSGRKPPSFRARRNAVLRSGCISRSFVLYFNI